MKTNRIAEGIRVLKNFTRLRFDGFVVNQNFNAFMPDEVAHDLGIHPPDGLKFAGPIVAMVGPGDPCGVVRFPLGGHAVAVGLGWGLAG